MKDLGLLRRDIAFIENITPYEVTLVLKAKAPCVQLGNEFPMAHSDPVKPNPYAKRRHRAAELTAMATALMKEGLSPEEIASRLGLRLASARNYIILAKSHVGEQAYYRWRETVDRRRRANRPGSSATR
jgi:hypothetical protein